MPLTSYEMPFPCGESWTGTTRASHSPSSSSIDWNRPDDVGDPVVAAAAGVVTTAVPNGTHGYGRYVVVDHGNGESTLYAHLQTVNVGVGQTVDQGSMLGLLGETGNATGPHLHFEERLNGKTVAPYLHGAKYAFGIEQQSQNCPDVPLAGNFVGDGIAELAVFDRATATLPDQPAHGADHRSPYGVGHRPAGRSATGTATARSTSAYAAPPSAPFYLDTPAGTSAIVMGNRSDIPVAGDWDGNGTWDIGVRKASSNVFRLRKPDGKSIPVRLGKAGDIPVSGDWNGDGVTDLGVYDLTKARFTLRIKDANGLVWLTRVVYGTPGDLPVTGDWDGNGRTDLGVWQPSTAQFFQRIAAAPMAPATRSVSRVYGTARSGS